MGRNNNDFHEGISPSGNDVKEALASKKITMLEGHHLLGGDLDANSWQDQPLAEEYGNESMRVYRAGTPFGEGDMNEEKVRKVHKNAGLKSDW